MTTDPTCRECGGLGYVTEDGGREHSPCQSCAAQPVTTDPVPLSADLDAIRRALAIARPASVAGDELLAAAHRALNRLATLDETRATPSGDLVSAAQAVVDALPDPLRTASDGGPIIDTLTTRSPEIVALRAALRGSVSADSTDPLREVLHACVNELDRLWYLHGRPGATFEGKVGEPDQQVIARGRAALAGVAQDSTEVAQDSTDPLRVVTERAIRAWHMYEHPDCRPGPVEECASGMARAAWAALDDTPKER